MNDFNIKEVKVHRTLEGNILELLFLVMMIAVWVLIIRFYISAPDSVPVHFDSAGRATSYDSKLAALLPCIFTTIAAIIAMGCAYFPHRINIPIKITNIRQVQLAITMARIIGLLMLVMTFTIGWTMLGSVNHGSPTTVPILSVVGAMFVVVIIFTILINKAK
jgi:uncharacterized membrane protein